MKRLLLCVSILSLFVASCGKEGEATIEYTTLSQLLEKSEPTSKEFDIHIKGLIVTAVFKDYVQMEDATAGVQLTKNDASLKVGDEINGKITGKVKSSSGSLIISSLSVSAATLTTAAELPLTTLKLSEVLSDKGKYYNRRLKLENITFVKGFDGSANSSGTFSQKGVETSVLCRPSGLKIENGSQGDLICYTAGTVCYVYSTDAFSEHEITSPFALKSTYGVYSISADDTPSEQWTVRPNEDQYVYGVNGQSRIFILQNYDEGKLMNASFSKGKLMNGQKTTVSFSSIGSTGIMDATRTVFVEKQTKQAVWFMDYENNQGFIFPVTEE